MNILYLTTHLNTGGITSYILTLAKGMKQKGHNVYVASSGGELAAKLLEAGVTNFNIPIKTKQEFSPKVFVSLFKLLKFAKENNIDIIHSNTRVTQVLGFFLGALSRRAYISTCHGFFKGRFFRKIFPCWGKKVIAISEPVREHLVKDFGVRADNIRLIHNGIDTERFKYKAARSRESLKRDLGLEDGPVVGTIGRLSDVKGHIYLVEAMKTVLEKAPGAKLLIVGEGNMEKELKAMSLKLGIEKNICFLAGVPDTAEILSVMDVFAMPSLNEGLGLSLMEAMSMGLAVVGSSVGGIKSLIKPGYNGLLVGAADSRGLAGAILELFGDRAKAESLGRNAREFVRQNFSQDKMIQETVEVYSACLKESS
ncbi:MAG: glycosyltransferase family 4 protein [Candidatus Omnitrophica bacterium]|nr:glycosyltransferase family 4 protein [Candidatus Omnitrophota bacterium]